VFAPPKSLTDRHFKKLCGTVVARYQTSQTLTSEACKFAQAARLYRNPRGTYIGKSTIFNQIGDRQTKEGGMKYLRTLGWYLQRPQLYSQFLRAVIRKLSQPNPKDESRVEATAWCAERAIDTETALAKLTGASLSTSIRQKYPTIFVEAQKIADACPVGMGGAGELDLLYYLAESCAATRVIETGVAYGWSSLSLLLSLSTRRGARLISTDMPYCNLNNDSYVGCVVPHNLRNFWELVRLPDRDSLPRAIKTLGQLDMCHYDSDKSYDGRCWAYPLLWNAIRVGGVFISDDIGDNVGFRDFSESIGAEPVIVLWDDKYIGVIVKEA
jgi:predicted O-methyltransferase YrrM